MNTQTQSETKQTHANKRIKGTNFEPSGNISGWGSNQKEVLSDEIDWRVVGASVDILDGDCHLLIADSWLVQYFPGSAYHTDIRNTEMDRKNYFRIIARCRQTWREHRERKRSSNVFLAVLVVTKDLQPPSRQHEDSLCTENLFQNCPKVGCIELKTHSLPVDIQQLKNNGGLGIHKSYYSWFWKRKHQLVSQRQMSLLQAFHLTHILGDELSQGLTRSHSTMLFGSPNRGEEREEVCVISSENWPNVWATWVIYAGCLEGQLTSLSCCCFLWSWCIHVLV